MSDSAARPRIHILAHVRSRWWLEIVLMWGLAAALVFGAAMLGVRYLPAWRGLGMGANMLEGSVQITQLNGVLARWDSVYYNHIARYGYSIDGPERAFYPFYPYLVRWSAGLLGGNPFWAGLLISALAFLGAGFGLYRLVITFQDEMVVLRSVASMFFFPVAFFCFAFYPESLLLLFSILAVWLARRGNFALSGVAIALAGATRPTGWLLGLPYILEFVQQKDCGRKRILPFALGLLVAPLGTLLVMTTIIPSTHPTWRFWEGFVQVHAEGWKRGFTWPWITFYDAIQALVLGTGINPEWSSRASTGLDLAFTLLLLVACIIAVRKMPLSLYAYLIASTVFFLAFHGPEGHALLSMPRWVLTAFPVYAALGALVPAKSTRLAIGWFVLSALLLVLLTAWFAAGRWVA